MADFAGKRVLITGASRGLGRQLALDFASWGARMVVNFCTSLKAAEDVVNEMTDAGGDAFASGADIGDRAQVERMFAEMQDRFGGIDVLVNNAGINRDAAFLDMTDEDWDAVMATNLRGPFLCTQIASRMMKGNGSGRIVNISAVTAVQGRAEAANYSASKAGLDGMTRALAVELGPEITVNSIALGFFDSPLLRDIFPAEKIAAVENGLPTGRIGQFADVSAMVRYLASDEAAFVTGQTISLDGGQAIRLA